ncbi:hypothetical protein PA598K_03325 [Paenibacillus sp. 598K]|uniref:helix-turn-helix domain-containing protein n=1 Tax=Paenibacillus sp. 598K TaxID=1117987 RepID=UPI000FFA060C|nr:AraC family transcriptional regulator [Paenibacillus sp. 598K]GBF74952.1 hypothetical protein PA598K_03325 [Paenibacillus sp. 598K]
MSYSKLQDDDPFEVMRANRLLHRIETAMGGQRYRLSERYGSGYILRRRVGEGIVFCATTYERVQYTLPDSRVWLRPMFEMILIVEGGCSYRFRPSEEWHEFARGDLIFYQTDPDVSAVEMKTNGFVSISLELDPTLLELSEDANVPWQQHLSDCLGGTRMVVTRAPERIIARFRQLSTMEGLERAERYFQWKGLTFQVLSECLDWASRSGDGDRARIPLTQEDRQALERVRQALEREPDRSPSLAELSRLSCMNATKVKQGFKQLYHTSISMYTLESKVAAGKRKLLESNDSITDIAVELGYSNPSKFSAIFKKLEGMTPREWRGRYRDERNE